MSEPECQVCEGTLWEQFGGTINIGQGSRNHIMLGGFEGPFFYGNLAGIQNVGTAWCGKRLFCAPFYTNNRIFYQDRLGTNTGKVEKREADLFCCRDRTLIAPTVAGNLTGVEATVGTVRGDIKVEWSSSDTACGFGKVIVYLVDRSKHSTAAETAALSSSPWISWFSSVCPEPVLANGSRYQPC